ncbi:MAG TPA: adenylate/guanylate cyclase domain-containing protein [Paraburkholderia sp.]
MDIDRWLHELGLGQYVRAFADNDIDGAMLLLLTDADLKELGVASLGHRKRLLAAIAGLVACADSPAAAVPADERRQVTILFADLCGFTALSQTLDPEELQELVGRYTALVDGIVLGYGGTVDKHIGDAVMALFGAPRAHETDTLRAARAAVDIHDALAHLSQQTSKPLRAHIGIASGAVVAGALGRANTHDYTVHGDPVNLAARLVSAAGPGETFLSDSVHRSLGDAAVNEPLGEIQFKGVAAPVRVWRLTSVAGEPMATSRSVFVGRMAELEQLKGVMRACLAEHAGHVICIRGEAGIGKTRLVDEMRRFAQTQGFAVHRGLVLDFGMGTGKDPVREIVVSLLGLAPRADVEARVAAIERLASAGVISAQERAFLRDLLDLPQTSDWRTLYDAMDHAARERGKRALVATLAADACRRGPVMIVVEDLHWADPQVLGYLAAFAAALTNGPGLLTVTSRVDGDPIDAAWRTRCRGTPLATIDLGPLRRDEAMNLAGGFVDATQRIALACIERAGGNPLFLEQLLRNADEGTGDAVPATIQSLVLARMDRLTPPDRQAFQAAAVIGQRFDLALLRHLVDDPDYVCDRLIANALVVTEGEDFLFAHALIQEGAYSTLLRGRRRDLHRLAAEWFGQNDRVLYAQHLDRAQDERAPDAYLDAASAQRAAYLADAALRLVERGLTIVQSARERHALTCLKGALQLDRGDIAASIGTYRLALDCAPDEPSRCRSQLGLAEGLRVNEGLSEALELLQAAEEIAQRHAMVAELAGLHHLRGNILFPLGRIDACRTEHEQGLAHARRLGMPEAEARALGGLADAAYAQGRMRTAFEHFSRCVALSREHGFGRIEVAHRSMQGFSRIYLNEAREARDDAVAAARAAALVGQLRAHMLCETLNVYACFEMGDTDATLVHLEHEMQLIGQLGARRFEAQNIEIRGRVLLDCGHRAEAEKLLREALSLCREVGTQFSAPKTLSALSRAVEDNAERLRLLAEGEDLLDRGAVGHNFLWFYRDAIEAMLSARDAGRALHYVAALENYTRAEPLPWAELFAARARALALTLGGRTDATVFSELERVRVGLMAAGFAGYLSAVEAALAA